MYRFKAQSEDEKLITGYKIGGVTPILLMWNEGGFTREDIQEEYDKWNLSLASDEEAYYEMEASNIEDLKSDFNTMESFLEEFGEPFDVVVREMTEKNMEDWRRQKAGLIKVLDGLRYLLDMTDDFDMPIQDDEDPDFRDELCKAVHTAHYYLDEHIRNETYGNYVH